MGCDDGDEGCGGAGGAGEGHSLVSSVGLVSCALGLGGFQAAGLGSNHQDLAPRWAGILYGVTNAFASVFGVAGIMGTGARHQPCSLPVAPCQAACRGAGLLPHVAARSSGRAVPLSERITAGTPGARDREECIDIEGTVAREAVCCLILSATNSKADGACGAKPRFRQRCRRMQQGVR